MISPKRPLWWRMAGGLLVVGALVWTALLLAKGWESADFSLLSPRLLPSLFAFILAAASIAVAFPSFWWLVRASGAPSPPLGELARLHFVSQLMRHLPGRFVGVAYQVAIARHLATAAQWVGANATYMCMALWVATALPVALLMLVDRVQLGVAGVALVTLVVCPLVVVPVIARVGRAHHPQGILGHLVNVMVAVAASVCSRGFGHALAWYGASWIVYGLAWAMFGTSISSLGAFDGLVLCAFYSLAWALGFLAVVTPSGLGVRELAFAALAKDFPPEVIAYTAVVARLGLLGADLLLGIASLWIGRWKHV